MTEGSPRWRHTTKKVPWCWWSDTKDRILPAGRWPAAADLHYEVRSVLEAQKQAWRLRSTSGAVAEELIEAARAIALEGGPFQTVVIVIGSDHRLAFSVPITLARQSGFPLVIVP